jgi:hypothetical protein
VALGPKRFPRDRANLPVQFRSLPDLLVADAEVEHAYLVEVKYRKRLDAETARELRDAFKKQRERWPEAYAVIMLAEPMVASGQFHQDYIRVLPLKESEKLVNPHHGQILKTSSGDRPITADDWAEVQPDESLRMRSVWEGLRQLQNVFRYFH